MSSTDFPAPRVADSRLLRMREAAAAIAGRSDLLVLAAIILLALVIRILTIDNQSFWTDEALTAYETKLPFGAMLNTVAHFETTPPLYFVLIWGWAKLFGSGEIALRSLSELGGLALIPIAYVTGRELVTRWAGVLAAAFVAINPLMIWFSQEARSYMLLAVLTAACFLWFTRAARVPSQRNLLWWTALSALSLMTHFFAGFIVAPEAIWLLWRWRSGLRPQRSVALAVGVIVLVQVAMTPFALIDTSHGTGWIGAIPRVHRIANLVLEWGIGTLYRRATNLDGIIGGLVLVTFVALLFAFGGSRELRERAKLPAAITAFVFIAPLLLGLVGQDYFLSRNAIPAFVPAAVVIAAACLMPRTRVLGVGLAVALLAIFSVASARVQTHAYLQRPPWAQVARAIGPAPVPRAILVSQGITADPLKIYLPGVNWVQSHAARIWIREIDVVGVRKSLLLRFKPPPGPPVKWPTGWAVPRRIQPAGTRLIARFRVNNWIVGRYRLVHPLHVSLNLLAARALTYFTHTPAELLAFSQRPLR